MVYFLLFQALRKKKLIFDKIVFAIGEKKLFKIYVKPVFVKLPNFSLEL